MSSGAPVDPFAPVGEPERASAEAHLRRAAREAARLPPGAAPAAVERAGILGFGTMGRGIALAFAGAGIPAIVFEPSEAAWDRSAGLLVGSLDRAVARGKMDRVEADRRRGRISRARSLAEAASGDFVVEAAFEDLALKERLFRELGGAASREAVLATNTSSLDVDRIAAASGRPEQVIGAHFFSPAHAMPLLEVVVGRRTSPGTLATTLALAARLSKVPVPVGVCDGFVGNRMLYAYRRAADDLLLEGALPEEVDAALRRFGFPMGPYEVADLAGLDIGHTIRRRQAEEAVRRGEPAPPPVVADRLVARGRLGQKTGAGFYRYESRSRTGIPDLEVRALVEEESRRRGVSRRAVPEREILDRCLTALVQEGRRIVEEGIARRPGDVDLIWTLGYGFPRARGGPLYWADRFARARPSPPAG